MVEPKITARLVIDAPGSDDAAGVEGESSSNGGVGSFARMAARSKAGGMSTSSIKSVASNPYTLSAIAGVALAAMYHDGDSERKEDIKNTGILVGGEVTSNNFAMAYLLFKKLILKNEKIMDKYKEMKKVLADTIKKGGDFMGAGKNNDAVMGSNGDFANVDTGIIGDVSKGLADKGDELLDKGETMYEKIKDMSTSFWDKLGFNITAPNGITITSNDVKINEVS